MKIYQPLLFSFLLLFLLSSPKTTSAENCSGTGNCWDDFYDPPAATTQVVRIDVLGIEVTIPSNYEIPLNRKWGKLDIIGSEKAGKLLSLADDGVQAEGSICSQQLDQIPRQLEISFQEQVMAYAQRERLEAERYQTENLTAYLIHSPGASRATMMILTPDRENILILSAYCSDCPVPVLKLIDLVNTIKFIEN